MNIAEPSPARHPALSGPPDTAAGIGAVSASAPAGPALLSLFLIWAALYLPCLGSLALRGEEGRRILPGIAMLQTGDWILPRLGGDPYLRKPPLLNWLIAGSIQLTGAINEWSVRLPSVLAVLALAAGMYLCGRRWLPPSAAWIAAVLTITNIGLVEKGRLAELEALYIACFGLAFSVWLAGEMTHTRAAHWIGAGALLGLGLMTKGPLPLLLFFYISVGSVLLARRRLREFLSWPHGVGLLLTIVPVLTWTLAQTARINASEFTGVWKTEMTSRFLDAEFKPGRYLTSIFQNLTNFLPWALFLPLLWHRRVLDALPEAERIVFTALRRGWLIGLVPIALLPGSRPRYTMPLLVLASWLIAWAMARHMPERAQRAWRGGVRWMALGLAAAALVAPWIRHPSPGGGAMLACAVLAAGALGVWWWLCQPAGLVKLTGTTAAVIALGVGLYCAMIVPVQVAQTSEDRAEATELSRLLPPDAALYAVRTGYERMLFYLGLRVQYPASLEALPRQENVFALLREPEDLQRVATLPGAARLHSFAGGEDQKPRELWRFDNRR